MFGFGRFCFGEVRQLRFEAEVAEPPSWVPTYLNPTIGLNFGDPLASPRLHFRDLPGNFLTEL